MGELGVGVGWKDQEGCLCAVDKLRARGGHATGQGWMGMKGKWEARDGE